MKYIKTNVNLLGQTLSGFPTFVFCRQRKTAANKKLPEVVVTNFYETFVLNQTVAFQINNSSELLRLRQYPEHYLQVKKPNNNNHGLF